MSMSTPEESHEFVVSPELAEAAKRSGVELHAGDRVRFEVIEGGQRVDDDRPARREPWPPVWVGSIKTGETDLGARAREVMRAELDAS